MGFTIYSSGDSSAPVLTGEAGSLVNVFDKCLVAGYPGTSAAGWTKEYTGANKAAFKQGAGSCGFYLRVQDDGPGTGTNYKEARITGYTAMTDVDTGSGPFPMASQGLGGTVAAWSVRKSDTEDTVGRAWVLVADSRTFYFFPSILATTNTNFLGCGFGDFYSMAPGLTDAYRCFIAGMPAETDATVSGNQNYATLCKIATTNAWAFGSPTGFNLARSWGGIGSSIVGAIIGDGVRGSTAGWTIGVVQVPNSPDSGMYIAPLWVGDVSGLQLRGRMRGLWHWLHPYTSCNHGDVFSGTGPQAGKTFLLLKAGNSVNCIETSDTLETNA